MQAVDMDKVQAQNAFSDASYIYVIKCNSNGKMYVGKTRNPRSRKMIHLYALRKGTHSIEVMQKDFNLYGEKKFDFVVIERCTRAKREDFAKEKEWMKKFKSYDIRFGYNYKDPKFHPTRPAKMPT